MRDWSGTRIRIDALAVPCRYCKAIAGEECVTDRGTSLQAFPAHDMRVRDAMKGKQE